MGCSLWGHSELDMTERLHFHFSLSCIGEGNGNPLQCSCLENPRDGGAWWAAVSGVAQSRTQLKRLSSSSSSLLQPFSIDYHCFWASQGTLVVKNLPTNEGDIRDASLIPGWGRSPEEWHGNALQYFCLENPRDRGAWWAAIYGVAQSRTHLK